MSCRSSKPPAGKKSTAFRTRRKNKLNYSHLKFTVMNALRNSVTLIGHLGNNPEMRTVGDNRRMARFSIATNDYYYDKKGARVEETIWHNVVAWGKAAEVAEKILSKGREAAIQGKLVTRTWEDKEGEKHYITEVVANEILVFGNGNQK